MKNFKFTIIAVLLLGIASITAQSINTSRNYRIWNAFTNDGLSLEFTARLSPGSGSPIFSRVSGNEVRIYRSVNRLSEVWGLEKLSNGYYTITNTFSQPGESLSIDSDGATQEGSRLKNNSSNASESQQWKLTSVGRGNYIITNRVSGLAITRDTRRGVLISQKRYVGSNLQKWFFQDAGEARGPVIPATRTSEPAPFVNLASIAPNPARTGSSITYNVASSVSGRATIQLINFNGQVVESRELDINRGFNNSLSLSTRNATRGNFIVRLTLGSASSSQNLIIQ